MNPNFGSEEDLKALVAECHKRDMLIMVDVVFNHMGYVPNGFDYENIVPFNDAKYYHEYCEMTDEDVK